MLAPVGVARVATRRAVLQLPPGEQLHQPRRQPLLPLREQQWPDRRPLAVEGPRGRGCCSLALEESADRRRRRRSVARIRNGREQAVLHLPPRWKPAARYGVRTLRQPFTLAALDDIEIAGIRCVSRSSRRLGDSAILPFDNG